MPHGERRPDDDKPMPGVWELAGIGVANAGCLFAGVGLGWLVDSLLGTLPVFILIGMLSGIALGVASTYQRVRKYLND